MSLYHASSPLSSQADKLQEDDLAVFRHACQLLRKLALVIFAAKTPIYPQREPTQVRTAPSFPQKLGHFQPVIAVFPECMGQVASSEPT